MTYYICDGDSHVDRHEIPIRHLWEIADRTEELEGYCSSVRAVLRQLSEVSDDFLKKLPDWVKLILLKELYHRQSIEERLSERYKGSFSADLWLEVSQAIARIE